MSVYFGAPNNKGMNVSESLSSMGINLLRTAPRAILPVPYVNNRQPAYITYTRFLAPYMSAYISQMRTPVNRPGYNISGYNGPLIPMQLPPLSVSFAKDIPQEAMDKIKELGGNDQMIQRTRVFIIQKFDSSFVKDMVRAGAIKTSPSPQNTVNLFTIPVLVFLRKLLSCFFRTHTYPAFNDVDHVASLEGLHMLSVSSKRKAGDDRDRSSKRGRTDPENAESHAEDEMETEEAEDTSTDPLPPSDVITVALPPRNDLNGWGDENSIPVAYGLFFHYVPELAEFDNRTIPEVISKYFFYALGSTETDIRKTFEDIRTATGIIANSSLGKEWSHMLKVIDIGLNTQSRIYPVFSDERYIGCVVSGYNFSVQIYDKVYTPVPHDQLSKVVMDASPFKSTLDAICTFVPDPDNDLDQYSLGRGDISSIIDLRRFVAERAISEKERDEIRRLAMKLRFPQQHWSINPQSISNALLLASSVRDELPDDLPLHPSMIFEKDWFSCIWSGFGALAPSCVFNGGPIVDLTSSTAATGQIAFRQTSLTDAVREMQTVIRDKKFAKAQGNRRSGSFKDRLFQGDSAKSIWNALRKFAGVDMNRSEKKAKEAGGSSVIEDYDF